MNIYTILNLTVVCHNDDDNKRKAVSVIISYEPLWDTMKEKGVSQYKLLRSGIDNKTLDRLKKDKNVTLLTIEKLCQILECAPNDIVKFT